MPTLAITISEPSRNNQIAIRSPYLAPVYNILNYNRTNCKMYEFNPNFGSIMRPVEHKDDYTKLKFRKV